MATIAGYAGPSPNTLTIPVPINIMTIPVLEVDEWIAISDSNATNVPGGGQNSFVLTSQTPDVTWTLGNFVGSPGGSQFITELSIGIYERKSVV